MAEEPADRGIRPSTGDPLAPWRGGVAVRPVSEAAGRHTIHSYYTASPESPDGSRVLYLTSTTPDAQEGELRILERATGKEQVIARGVTVEDAHRVACQQWVSRGRVVFHDVRDGHWLVAVVDLDTGRERILARDRQLGWGQPRSNPECLPGADQSNPRLERGQPDADEVPVYGCHWNPGEHRDLEMVNVETGAVRTVVTASAVKEAYPEWIARQFGGREVSIFFPVLSPDRKRVFFKMAAPAGGDFRSPKASTREGLICYDLGQSRLLFMRKNWGHPAWAPDARTIIEVGNVLIDSDTGHTRRIPGLPTFPGSHPSISPDGRLFVTDVMLGKMGGQKGEWGIAVGRMDGGEHAIIHRFDNSRGARSWRRSHPHPSFSPDGRRIYFNVSATEWTRLYVAEAR